MKASIVTVIGPNGAGKTTLLAAIMGLLPSRGDIVYAGARVNRTSVEERVAQRLCLVPERRELFAAMTVADNLELGAFHRHRARDRTLGKTRDEVYQRFPRLAERRAQLAGTLSGGERQMLALGRALMARPRLLLLDEPSLGLAPLIVKEIFSIIAALKASGVSDSAGRTECARRAADRQPRLCSRNRRPSRSPAPARRMSRDARVAATYLGRAPDSSTAA